jgi:hypothetical protein
MDNARRRLQGLKEPLLPVPDSQVSERSFSLRRRRGCSNHPSQLAPLVVDRVEVVVLVDVAESRADKVKQLLIRAAISFFLFHGPS